MKTSKFSDKCLGVPSDSKSHKKPSKKPRRLARAWRRLFYLAVFLMVVSFGLLSTLGENGLLDLVHLQSLFHSIESENNDLLKEQEELKAEVARLQDPRYMEFIARERLGLMRANEVFVILDRPASDSSVDKSNAINIPPSP